MTRCRCFVDGCSNTSYEKILKFFRIPTDPVTAIRWMKLIGRGGAKLTSKYYVCEEHFSDDCFYPRSIKKLTKDALPCLNLPPTSVDTAVMLHKSTQCQPPKELTSKTTKKRETMNSSAPSKNPKDTFNALCDTFLGPDIAKIVKKHAFISSKFGENRNDFEFIVFCLKFYYSSPASYLGLQKPLKLLDKKTLAHHFMHSIETNHSILYRTLKAKVDCMSDLEKQCYVLIGLVDLKPHLFYHIKDDRIYGFCENNRHQNAIPSDSAVVIYARGIYEPWTLVIDYALFCKTDRSLQVSSWFVKTIEELLSIGLNIRISIFNWSSDIIDIIATLTGRPNEPMTIEKPFFLVNEQHIYYTLNPTYLIKKVYNCFMEYEFHFRNTIARWQDIVDFYHRDSKKKFRLAPKLSEENVRCTSSNDKTYSVVMNTFSETVAAGISAYIEFGVMGEEALGTVRFLMIMSNLIDFTQSCNAPHHRELKRPFVGTEAQMNYIVEALNYFRDLKLYKNNVDVTDSVDCISDFQIAIKSLLMLGEDLKLENYPDFYTKNINFNVMNNFVNSVSKKNHRSGDLLAWKLVTEYRRRFFLNILRTPKYRYCSEVLNGIFFDYLSSSSLIDPKATTTDLPRTLLKTGWLSLPLAISDYKDLHLPSKNQMKAVGIFLLNKCLQKHTRCTLPNVHRKPENEDDDSLSERYPVYKYEQATKTLIPDQNFMLLIWELERDLEVYFQDNFLNGDFMLRLKNRAHFSAESFIAPCPCFPVVYLKKLFFRLRLSQILKMNNRQYKKSSDLLTFSYKRLS